MLKNHTDIRYKQQFVKQKKLNHKGHLFLFNSSSGDRVAEPEPVERQIFAGAGAQVLGPGSGSAKL
jgi:hypothetical protein